MIDAMDPARTALLLIGYQRDYFETDGALFSVIEESTRAGKKQHLRTTREHVGARWLLPR